MQKEFAVWAKELWESIEYFCVLRPDEEGITAHSPKCALLTLPPKASTEEDYTKVRLCTICTKNYTALAALHSVKQLVVNTRCILLQITEAETEKDYAKVSALSAGLLYELNMQYSQKGYGADDVRNLHSKAAFCAALKARAQHFFTKEVSKKAWGSKKFVFFVKQVDVLPAPVTEKERQQVAASWARGLVFADKHLEVLRTPTNVAKSVFNTQDVYPDTGEVIPWDTVLAFVKDDVPLLDAIMAARALNA